jgi:SUF system NifU family Fe-S assembly protein
MPLPPLYSDTVLEHNRAPRNAGRLSSATHRGEGSNASCGDHVTIEVECSTAGHVLACRFHGDSCAICTASASMLTEAVIGRDLDAVRALAAALAATMRGEDAGALPDPLAVFAELRNHPPRRRCAQLPFDALVEAMQKPALPRNPAMIEYRAAVADDIPAIVALVESAYRGDVSKQGWTTEADMLDGQRTDPVSVAALLQAPASRVLLALQGGELVGCVHVEGHDGVGYFGMFAVSPTAQGLGIGAALLDEAERVARVDFGCAIMTMTVISIRTELIAFYARRGYRATGDTKPFPYGDERFGIPKRGDLEFAVYAKALI